MKTLDSKDVIRIIKEEYIKKASLVVEDLDVFFSPEGKQEKNVIDDELKVRDDKGNLYTITSIGSWGAMLKRYDEEGNEKIIKVDKDTLEKCFNLRNKKASKKDSKDE